MLHQDIGQFLITAGGIAFTIGLFFLFSDKLPLGGLPGDLAVGRDGTQFLIPITTIILVSIAITLVLNFLSR